MTASTSISSTATSSTAGVAMTARRRRMALAVHAAGWGALLASAWLARSGRGAVWMAPGVLCFAVTLSISLRRLVRALDTDVATGRDEPGRGVPCRSIRTGGRSSTWSVGERRGATMIRRAGDAGGPSGCARDVRSAVGVDRRRVVL